VSPDDTVVAAGVLVSLLIAPAALVWPRAWAHIVIPRRLRSRVGHRPRTGAAAVAGPLALLSGGAMSVWMLGGLVHLSAAVNGAAAAGLVWLIFGGLTAVAFGRALLVGAGEWRLTDGRSTTPRRWDQDRPTIVLPTIVLPTTVLPTTVLPATDRDATDRDARADWDFDRPLGERMDRGLRGLGRWLAAGGLLWYLFGRLTQLTHLGGSDGVDVPGWWWLVSGVLLTTGAAVWLTRRWRWHRAAQAGSELDSERGRTLPEQLATWGFAVLEPAGEWLRSEAPGVFLPVGAVTGPSLWPWAAHGNLDGRPVVVAQHRAQVRNPTGLTFGRTRCACTVRVPRARLPLVVVCGREAVPPAQRAQSIDLELYAFNRSLWAWGPDRRGFHAVLHPLVLATIVRDLPDGASLRFAGDQIAVYSDEPVTAAQLVAALRLVGRLAEQVPTYLVR
jgi:hypothetical protein